MASTQIDKEQLDSKLKPYSNRWIRVRPKNITEKTRVRNIAWPRNVGNLLHLTQLRTQTPMHADNFVINDRGTRETIEGIAKSLP